MEVKGAGGRGGFHHGGKDKITNFNLTNDIQIWESDDPKLWASSGAMEVIVRLHGDLREKAGTDTVRVPIGEDETLDTLLMKLSRRHPRVVEMVLDPTTGELKESYDILLNGRRIQRTGIHTKLKHKDELMISPPASG